MNRICVFSALVLMALPSGVALSAARPPDWWNDPVREDSLHYFFAASGVSKESSDQALETAQANAVGQIATKLLGQPGIAGGTEISNYIRKEIRDWTLHAKHEEKDSAGWHVWVLIKYRKSEYARVMDMLAGGQEKYNRAISLSRDGKYGEAISLLDTLIKTYPVGAQPLFKTELALSLKAECCEKKNMYPEAREALRQILSAVKDPAIVASANEGLKRIDVKYPDFLLRKEFEGRNVAVYSGQKTSGRAATWPKMQDLLGTFMKEHGAKTVPPDSQSDELLINMSNKTTEITKHLKTSQADIAVVFTAIGKISTRENKENPAGKDFQFTGDIGIMISDRNRTIFADTFNVVTGWNPLGEKMCMDVLALNVMKRWQAQYLKSLGYVP